jgi:hypothetical protein
MKTIKNNTFEMGYLILLALTLLSCNNEKSEIVDDYMTIYEKEPTIHQIDQNNRLINKMKRATMLHLEENPNVELNWGISLNILNAVLIIDDRINSNLHPDLRKGLFEKPGRYNAIVRMNITGTGAARLSLRIAIPESMETLNESTSLSFDGFKQIDILLAENFKCFFLAPDVETINYGLDLREKKSILSFLSNPFKAFKLLRAKKYGLEDLNNTQGFFGKSYYGGLPFKLGPGAMKWGIEPLQSHTLVGNEIPGGLPGFDMTGSEEEAAMVYKKSLESFFNKNNSALFNFVIQVANHPSHNINISNELWDEKLSPYLPVGRLIFPSPEDLPDESIVDEYKNDLQFNPWNQLKAHRPLGNMNRARYEIYKEHSKTRSKHMEMKPKLVRCPIHQVNISNPTF